MGSPPEAAAGLDLAQEPELRETALSGLLWLTGHPAEDPRWAPFDVVRRLHSSAERIVMAAGSAWRGGTIEVDRLLTGRAGILGLTRQGSVSAGGSCQFLQTCDGWLALNMPRASDLELVPALVGTDDHVPSPEIAWSLLRGVARSRSTSDMLGRARLLGMAASELAVGRISRSGDPEDIERLGLSVSHAPDRPWTVVDLSAMWAGPLCASLLGDAGARVIKVESATRPDGARSGDPRFFDDLNSGHESVVLDFHSREGLGALHALLAGADVVIEASRPRALISLGVDARQIVAAHPGMTWIAITGHGPGGADSVAFGDDAAVAAGMAARDAAGRPVFVADALADPITGIHGARSVLESRTRGGGELIRLAMVDAVSTSCRAWSRPPPPVRSVIRERASRRGAAIDEQWMVEIGTEICRVMRPTAPPIAPRSRAMGADTVAVLDEFGDR